MTTDNRFSIGSLVPQVCTSGNYCRLKMALAIADKLHDEDRGDRPAAGLEDVNKGSRSTSTGIVVYEENC